MDRRIIGMFFVLSLATLFAACGNPQAAAGSGPPLSTMNVPPPDRKSVV